MRKNQNILTVDWNKEMVIVDGVNCISSLTLSKMFGTKKNSNGKLVDVKPHKDIVRFIIGDAKYTGAIKQRENLFNEYVESGLIKLISLADTSTLELEKKRNTFVREYYKASSYFGKDGKEHKKYLLTEEGFYNVIVQLKGQQAERIRNYLIETFMAQRRVIEKNKMRAELLAELPEYHQARREGKIKRVSFTDAIKENITDVRALKGEGDGRYYQHFTDLIYKVLGRTKEKNQSIRDISTPIQLKEIEKLEDRIAKMITACDKDYKECYKEIRDQLLKELNV